MFNSKRGQMCVCNQVGHGLTILERLLKDNPMSFCRANDSCARLVQPALDASNCLSQRKRVLENPRVGRYSDERKENRPAQTDDLITG